MTRATHTLATMEVSPETFQEVKEKLEAAQYQHAISQNPGEYETLDMTGIGLIQARPNDPTMPVKENPVGHPFRKQIIDCLNQARCLEKGRVVGNAELADRLIKVIQEAFTPKEPMTLVPPQKDTVRETVLATLVTNMLVTRAGMTVDAAAWEVSTLFEVIDKITGPR